MRTSCELSHGRIDTRSIRLIKVDPVEINFPCVGCVAEIKRESLNKKSTTSTKGSRIYLSSCRNLPSREVLKRVRMRWNVENKNHHHRDGTFLEDKCRCRTGNTAANLALLRGTVLLIWKTTRSKLPAPAFVMRNQRKIDAMIDLLGKNQRLRNLQ